MSRGIRSPGPICQQAQALEVGGPEHKGAAPGPATREYALEVLERITFPPCCSRSKVKLDGALLINALPMVLILHYHLGLLRSTVLL